MLFNLEKIEIIQKMVINSQTLVKFACGHIKVNVFQKYAYDAC